MTAPTLPPPDADRPRVVLDLVPIHPGHGGAGGGIWSYAAALATELDALAPPDLDLVCLTHPGQRLALRRITQLVVPVDTRSPLRRLRWVHERLPALCRRHGVALLHKLATEVPWRPGGCRLVTTVQDFMLEHYRENNGESRRGGAATALRDSYFGAVTARCFARSDVVITSTEAVAAEARRRFPATVARLRVVPHGLPAATVASAGARMDSDPGASDRAGAAAAASAGIIGGPLRLRILVVGALLPHKGPLEAIRAFARLAAVAPALADGATLTFHGHTPDRAFADRVRAAAAASTVATAIRFRGYDAGVDGAALYRDADVLLQLSAYEGFGLPPLEAQAAGIPVVCSDIPVFREVLGDGARHVDRDDADAVAAAIAGVAGDAAARRALIARGLANAASYSWARSARDTVGVYRESLGGAVR
ncbi:MAG: glycosyltransferase [Gemmatimonadaceae bacterium]